MYNIPSQRGALTTLSFHPDTFAVLQASATEDIQLAMREDRRPRTLATNILERKQPSVAYRNVGYISLLAGMVEQFAERTDFVVTDMAMDMPAEIVGGLIEERRTRDDIAARLSRMIRAEADWLEVVDAETIDADAWAETWMLERD